MRPGEHPRRILLAVVGQSPQILTETVYALARSVPPADRFVPTEVQVLTTQAGAARLAERLLSPPSHVWRQLIDDHALGAIDFDETRIHLVVAADGRPLDDIRTAADNAAMADAVSERVRLLTADPDCALHVSLAGGRKTMGYYAGYALSLFGRSQDRLSHVLVDPVYEAAPDFHYPTPRRRMLRTRDGSAEVDASRAQVELAQIPYVRLRSLLPPAMLNAPRSSRRACAWTSAAADSLPTGRPSSSRRPRSPCWRCWRSAPAQASRPCAHPCATRTTHSGPPRCWGTCRPPSAS